MNDSPTPPEAVSVLPTVDDLIEAMSGRDSDDPISAGGGQLGSLRDARFLVEFAGRGPDRSPMMMIEWTTRNRQMLASPCPRSTNCSQTSEA
ncbi:hypothetical protein AB0E01_42590 [Nocardia vinacea]|uniref:hypothetical protein n=1 Tax=Nocardia vinacea TaxID=96468 RepID=UPI0033CB9D78